MTKSIQQILDEQKDKSKIHKVSNFDIGMAERSYNGEWIESQKKHNESMRGTTWTPNRKILTEEEMTEKMIKRGQNNTWRKNHAKAMHEISNDPIWIKNHNEAMALKRKEIHSVEYGTFESRQSLIDYMTSIGISNARGKIVDWLKSKPDEYYYTKK